MQHSLSLHKQQPIADQSVTPTSWPQARQTRRLVLAHMVKRLQNKHLVAWLTKHHPDAPQTTHLRAQLAPELCSSVLLRGVTPPPGSQQVTPHYSRATAAQKGPGALGKQRSDFRTRAGEAAFSQTEVLAGATVPSLSPPPIQPAGAGTTSKSV